MPLTQITPPGALPMDVLEARAHVRQDADFDDVKLRALLSGAVSFAALETRRALVASRWQLTLDSFPGPSLTGVPWGQPYGLPSHAILLERSPLVQLVAIEYLDMGGIWQTMPAGDYVVDAAGPVPRITPIFGRIWPIPMPQIGSVRVTFDAGYAAAVRVDASANSLTLINWRPLKIGEVLRLSNSGGALPAPLQPNTDYIVKTLNPTTGAVTLSATPAGPEIDLTDTGTGTHYAGTQVSAEPAGVIPEGIKAWMACRISDLYEHRGSTVAIKGQLAGLPWVDGLLDPFRAPLL